MIIREEKLVPDYQATIGNKTLQIFRDEDIADTPNDWDDLGKMVYRGEGYSALFDGDIENLSEYMQDSDILLIYRVYLTGYGKLAYYRITTLEELWLLRLGDMLFIVTKKDQEMCGTPDESLVNVAESLLKLWDDYYRDNIWGFKLYEDGEEIESVWGFYGDVDKAFEGEGFDPELYKKCIESPYPVYDGIEPNI